MGAEELIITLTGRARPGRSRITVRSTSRSAAPSWRAGCAPATGCRQRASWPRRSRSRGIPSCGRTKTCLQRDTSRPGGLGLVRIPVPEEDAACRPGRQARARGPGGGARGPVGRGRAEILSGRRSEAPAIRFPSRAFWTGMRFPARCGFGLSEGRCEKKRRSSAGMASPGNLPLRQAIARHLAVSRGALASARQVVIVSGSQQALDLIARLCVRPGDGIALEDPGYPEAHRVLSASAGRRFYAPVDDEGIDVDVLVRMTRSPPAPRLLYVTPSHQFPTGATLSLPRRLALLDWAARRNVLHHRRRL